jgi:hypothetical protein
MKALAEFRIQDRRGQDHSGPAAPAVDIVERDADGAECVYRMIDGRKVMVKRGGHAIEQLDHRFADCTTCGGSHMVVGNETFDPLKDCPRVGWQWRMGQPVYTSGVRILETQRDEAHAFNQSVSRGLNQCAGEIQRRTGEGV